MDKENHLQNLENDPVAECNCNSLRGKCSILMGVLIGVVVILAVALAWQMYAAGDLRQEVEELKEKRIELKSELEEREGIEKELKGLKQSQGKEVEVDTSHWQIYRNEKFGFELKHPENWKPISRENPVVYFDVRGNNSVTKEEYREYLETKQYLPLDEEKFEIDWMYFDGGGRYVDDVKVEVYSSLYDLPENESGLSLNKWIDNKALIAEGSKEGIEINGHKGIEVEEQGMRSYRSVYLKQDQRIYKISLMLRRPEEEMELFDEMLSTFRFIETGN